jgi:hypothetical protein
LRRHVLLENLPEPLFAKERNFPPLQREEMAPAEFPISKRGDLGGSCSSTAEKMQGSLDPPAHRPDESRKLEQGLSNDG